MLSRFALISLCAIILLLSSCDQREPLNRGMAIAAADMFVADQGYDWGPVRGVWPPPAEMNDNDDPKATLASTKRWWQIDFHGPHPDGLLPIVLVDADSGWTRFPPPDYVARQHLRVADAGSYLLVLSGSKPEFIHTEAERLNTLAKEAGYKPLFAVRKSRRRGVELVYGWNGQHGISPDPSLRAWVQIQQQWADDLYWINIAGQ